MTDTEPRNILPSRSERVEEVCASANPRRTSMDVKCILDGFPAAAKSQKHVRLHTKQEKMVL